jgi:hypothetical protein
MLVFDLGCAAPSLGPAHRPTLAFESTYLAPDPSDPYPNWPVPPDLALELLRSGESENRSETGAGGGTTGAERHTIYFPAEEVEFDIKWKAVPQLRLDGINNSPRKEVAAYALQRVFLDPEDYVVPTSGIRCVPLERYRRTHPMSSPTVVGIDCVLGVASVWLENVELPDELYSEERFLRDPTYAHFMSNLNVFTYLADHRDGREGNFLISTDDRRRRAFAVDNGITFGPWVYNYFVENWTHLKIPAVRGDSIERLRALERSDLDYLAVVEQLQRDESNNLQVVQSGPPLESGRGVTWRDGTIQFGLTRTEIDDVFRRIEQLLEGVDSGQIPVF